MWHLAIKIIKTILIRFFLFKDQFFDAIANLNGKLHWNLKVQRSNHNTWLQVSTIYRYFITKNYLIYMAITVFEIRLIYSIAIKLGNCIICMMFGTIPILWCFDNYTNEPITNDQRYLKHVKSDEHYNTTIVL
jgi:hypothetical protein